MPIVEVKNKVIEDLNFKQTHHRRFTVLDFHTTKGWLTLNQWLLFFFIFLPFFENYYQVYPKLTK